ncbi:Y-family DNA polymerase [Pseudahrensia aquimaris]|uniref:Y-family DNA polymerase n=1 Tax=Pseudahrensia aquimaris TaxID=744461 RepID=A0ABW3FD07_9HYPH
MTRRILFVRLPYFPIERFLKVQNRREGQPKPWWDEAAKSEVLADARPQGPLVLVTNGAKGTRISAVGPDAENEGLWPDMKLADARTMMPALRVEQHDIAADHAALSTLARWMLRYSPAVSFHGADGFLLDTEGCDHLFGGEHKMAEDIADRLGRMGFTTYLAFGDTPAACHALGHYGGAKVHILPRNHEPDTLDGLPVEALRLEDDTVVLLKRLGLKRIGDVRPLPRSALERRFRETAKSRSKRDAQGAARSVQWRLDQLCGAVAEPLRYIQEPKQFRITKPCPELALEQGAIGLVLDELLPELCALLAKAGQGARRFQLIGYRADGGLGSTHVALSQPVNKPASIRRLFNDRLDHIDCGYGIDLFVLEAIGAEPVHINQHDMMDAEQAQQTSASLAAFADSVGNRVARKAVFKPAPRTSHVPERSQRLVDVTTPVDWQAWKAVQPVWSPRPLRLLPRPEPAEVTAALPDSPPAQFVWRRVMRRVIRARGPERILPEWWHDDLKTKSSATFRDYYDVEDSEGRRYWIFRSIRDDPIETEEAASDDGDEQTQPDTVRTIRWFVHGLF